ncbi:MAG: methionine--tRNA ligase [Candidatus Latescibacteria bacterium]|nr:methionine--tRNA ligase [Candidatus Latescibacterota bacterium]
MKTSYVSTSIPYVNARPHVGFALELVQADVIARWRRLQGDDTYLLTGTDENAFKNVQAAAGEGLTPRRLCDRNAAVFQDLANALDISYNRFIRSSSDAHFRGASLFWTACRREDIVLRQYRGLYCVGCEDFYLKKDLEDGRCPVHGVEPEIVEETNYFFRLSAYQKTLETLIASGKLRILPETRRNEALGFIRQGLQDFSISRNRERSGGWGVPVPGDATQVMYVWFDALTNYLTGPGYGSNAGSFERYWANCPDRIHVIGKDILKFHAIFWPALLLSAGLPLPRTIFVHGHLTVEGRKIGKSLGNAVDPFPLIGRYGADALRYYLLRAVRSGEDGDVSEARIRDVYNTDLANGLGNLVRRLEALCERSGYGCVDTRDAHIPPDVSGALDRFDFAGALRAIWLRIGELNREIDAVRPWELLKRQKAERLSEHLSAWIGSVLDISWVLRPFLPCTAERIETGLSRSRIRKSQPLFPRLT